MNKFQLTVHQYRQKLEETFGYADEEMVKRYAVERQKYKQDLKLHIEERNSKHYENQIQYQEEVLERMVKSGCKSCEKRRQEKFIERLRNEKNS